MVLRSAKTDDTIATGATLEEDPSAVETPSGVEVGVQHTHSLASGSAANGAMSQPEGGGVHSSDSDDETTRQREGGGIKPRELVRGWSSGPSQVRLSRIVTLYCSASAA